jgi:hypothetical protein
VSEPEGGTNEAGPDLDGLIAAKVLKWSMVATPVGIWWYGHKRGEGLTGPPPYSTDIRAAWLVIDYLHARGAWTILVQCEAGWRAEIIWNLADLHRGYYAVAPTAPLAICRAVLAITASPEQQP